MKEDARRGAFAARVRAFRRGDVSQGNGNKKAPPIAAGRV